MSRNHGQHARIASARRLGRFLLPAFAVLSLGCVTVIGKDDAGVESDGLAPRIVAYSWTGVDESLENIVPFHWIRRRDLSDIDEAVRRAREATDAMPAGHRVIFSWNLHRSMAWHPRDTVTDAAGSVRGHTGAGGRFVPYRSLWWDHGVEEVRGIIDDFFARYAAAGGRVDVFVLDFEQGFSYWHLEGLAQREYGGDTAAYFAALEEDPRFPGLAAQAGMTGLQGLLEWYAGDDYLRWGALMYARLEDYINRAVYEPLRKHFPDVRMSNYGFYHMRPDLPVPNRDGAPTYRYGRGTHVGTHQSRHLYGWLGNIRKVSLDGVTLYAATPFNAFRYDVNKMRAMKLAAPVPVHPWIANKEFERSVLRNSDLYQELVFHTLLTGVDEILFWNPVSTGSPATPESNSLLDGCIGEVNALLGRAPRRTLVEGLVDWGSDYVLTGLRAGERTVWRFTPRLRGKKVEDFLVRDSPATFRVGAGKIVIEGGRIHSPSHRLSRQGYWIVAGPAAGELP